MASCNAQGIYPLGYFTHNYHFLAATTALEGRGKASIEAAYQVANHADKKLMNDPKWTLLQHFYTIPYYVLVKFVQWDYILNLEEPETDLKYPKAVWRYARGMAYAAKDDLKAASLELEIIREIEKDTLLKELRIWETNSVHSLVQIASKVLAAEIMAKKHNFAAVIQLLKGAVEIEDNLIYQEPPDWFFSSAIR